MFSLATSEDKNMIFLFVCEFDITHRTYYNASTSVFLVHHNLTNAEYRTIGYFDKAYLHAPFKTFSDNLVLPEQFVFIGNIPTGIWISKEERYCSVNTFFVPNFMHTRRKMWR